MALYMQKSNTVTANLPVSEAERAARIQLAGCYRVFAQIGWAETIFNHITLRVPGPERVFLINPFGLHYREVTATNLVAVDINGNPVRETQYPINRAGFVIHSAIHANVEDAHCVMHTHTTTGMAVSCLKDGLSHNTFNGAQLKGRVAYHEFEGVTVRADEQKRMLAAIGDKRAVILRNHGLLTIGRTLPEAFATMYTLQRACDVQIAASAAGAMNPITPAAIEQSVGEYLGNEPRACELLFDAMVRLVGAQDTDFRN